MPSKCPFCRLKYTQSGAYEKHLRTAYGGLDIVLASTVQYINMESSVSHNPDASERQHSDCESDPGPPGLDPNAFYRDIAYESDTEVLDDATSPSAANRFLMKVPEKPPETFTGLSTNTATCARTLGHHSIARKVSN